MSGIVDREADSGYRLVRRRLGRVMDMGAESGCRLVHLSRVMDREADSGCRLVRLGSQASTDARTSPSRSLTSRRVTPCHPDASLRAGKPTGRGPKPVVWPHAQGL